MVGLKKRGLSPVIASVLLVLLAVVSASTIFLWARGFVSEQVEKGGKPIQEVCKDVSFDLNYDIVDGASRTLDLQIVNKGNVPINNFDVKFIGGKGDTNIERFDFGIDIGSAVEDISIPISDMNVESLVFYPMILGTVQGKKVNRAITCLDNGRIVQLS